MIQIFQSVKICNIYVVRSSCRAKFNLAVFTKIQCIQFSRLPDIYNIYDGIFDRYDQKKIFAIFGKIFVGCEK